MKKNISFICSVLFLFCFLGVAFAECQNVAECKVLAEQGDADAQFNLGLMYYNGQGVLQDYEEAVKWCILAAEQGYAKAQLSLGKMYYYGKSVTPNCSRAYMWLNVCAANGDSDCIKNRDIVAKKMSNQHIAKAQKMAKTCLESNYKNCD